MVRRAFGSTFSEGEIEDFYSSAWLGTLRTLAKRHEKLADDEIKSYLLTAVANHAGKEIRRRRRKPIAPLDDTAAVVPDAGATPEETVAARESSLVARDVLSSLPPRRRAVMLLRYGLDLEPKEVCGLITGLSHRAYRKEISRGVDEMAAKMRQVEAGEWCDERESLLKSYAAGLASADEAQQAEKHLSHCKPCSDFVGRLSGHLHDLGGAVALSGSMDSIDGHVSLPDRVGDLVARVRGGGSGQVSGELAAASSGGRGAGAVGGGVAAKLAGLGAGGKLAALCVSGGIAATVCAAAGVGPVALPGHDAPAPEPRVEHRRPKPDRAEPIHEAVVLPPVVSQPPPQAGSGTREPGEQSEETSVSAEPAEPVAPPPPPAATITGLAPAGSVSSGSDSGSASSSGGGSSEQANVQQEFGP
jgi:RNA polymerase sigma factor (sigma-70 family)